MPCNQCDICQSISTGDDVDVLEIDGASNRGIDEIRQLRQNVNVRPSRSRFKIYIIDEVHMLTREAFNALLKTLEEPPEHVKFIFCTTEATKIPVTILSRCQRFDFAGISTRSIAERLGQIVEAEGVEAEPEALEILARRAAGSMRDSQSLLEQLLAFASGRITVADVHGMLGTAGDERLRPLWSSTWPAATRPPRWPNWTRPPARASTWASCSSSSSAISATAWRPRLAAGRCVPLCLWRAAGQEVAEAGQAAGLQTILAAMQILDQTLSRLPLQHPGPDPGRVGPGAVVSTRGVGRVGRAGRAVAVGPAGCRNGAGSGPSGGGPHGRGLKKKH